MKKLLSLLAILTIVFFATSALAVTGTLGTQTMERGTTPSGKRFVTITVPWTSTAGGAFVATTDEITRADTSTYTVYIQNLRLKRMTTVPGATAPTDNYDITITTDDGEDILGGEGANRDTSTSETVTPAVGNAYQYPSFRTKLTINISNAGNAKTGTVILYFVE